ncbi:hypothetical protein fh0823_23230 [Francisella halioticida]|uniref:Mga helix-turn-helix domain-containing protein n=1 Tax=Francisella halioticida TaxID=549298 RepID=A0ABN5AZE9_9GAMM|nr:helix-turn-helix domain-containing protein [Francisella halioticida]ASG68915.1 hypothetical protein CDV26_11485 [Francisella halioticida]BCD92184.1 hypothetical protein fh0823_23230 [Francisella halioticida]
MQLDLFTHEEVKLKPRRNPGRPSKITEEKVFAVMNDINKQSSNKKLTNKIIIQKHNISERTFYRIKSGDKKYLEQFNLAVQKESEEFSLILSE